MLQPQNPQEVASALAHASRERQRVGIRGGGTKAGWGLQARPVDVELSTARLNTIIAHRHGDLTATVEAGAILANVNRALAAHDQWIPLDPMWADRATIGGVVSTNDAGPRRHRYGAPRDLIIGVEFVRADGVRAKAGGIVVKNVAGYDVARLMTGAFGCLGVIVNATFKLYPLPKASRTVVIDAPSHMTAEAIVMALLASQLTPTAVELAIPPARLLVRFESTEGSVEAQGAEAVKVAVANGATTAVVRGDAEAAIWRDHAQLWERPGTIAKVTLLPSELASMLDAVAKAADGAAYEVRGRAALGILYVRFDGDEARHGAMIEALRRRSADPRRGSVVILRASNAVKAEVDPWGPMGDAFALMQSVKRSFDPAGMLNPGCGPGGL
jgi:glycolate oxidase FAD binding subunit